MTLISSVGAVTKLGLSECTHHFTLRGTRPAGGASVIMKEHKCLDSPIHNLCAPDVIRIDEAHPPRNPTTSSRGHKKKDAHECSKVFEGRGA